MAGIRDASCRTQWPSGLRRGFAAACLLGLWVRIPPGALMSVSCECRVLSGRNLCDGTIPRTEESYWVWCLWAWSWSLRSEEALIHYGVSRQGGGEWDAKFAKLHVTSLVLLKERKKQWCQWRYIYKGLGGEDIWWTVPGIWSHLAYVKWVWWKAFLWNVIKCITCIPQAR
jgi:hypothetical protein